jgi:hypothetical protein
MARSAPAACIAGALVVLAVISSCDGKLIHLGNGPLTADGGSCPSGQVNANEVLWIGDSWVLVPGSQHTHLRDLARAAGAIGANDDYVLGAVAASTMAAIANQYSTQEATSTKVKVVIMDGGTWDTIVANGSDASVTSAASGFTQFLATVASDATVQHVIYFLTPELPNIPGVAALRPLVRQACTDSAVPCHFLDLQPLWIGHPEYTASDNLFPTDTGAQALANAIWAVMQGSCIAQ